MARKVAAAALWIGFLHSGSALALGLGELKLESFLNEPLRARVDLLDTAGLQPDQIRVRLATVEDFDRLGVERSYFLTGISFEVIVDGSDRGQILLRSEQPVLEPYLDFILEARWPAGRLLREYTVLLDPPVFDAATRVVSASETVAATEPREQDRRPGRESEPVAADSRTRTREDAVLAERAFAAGASPTPQPGSRYLVNRNDTLWEIASRGRPAGASVHQTMLDIQRLNPDAFIDGNINRIKAGYVIYLPGSEEISSGDLEQALAEVRQQNEDWRAGRVPEAADAGPSLTISAGPEEPRAAGGGGGTGESGPGQSGPGQSAAMQELLDTVEQERAEVESRLSAMEQQLQTLQQIVTLKDEQIAALQDALAAAGSERATAAADSAAAADGGPQQAAAPEPAAASEPSAAAPTQQSDAASPAQRAAVPAAQTDSDGGLLRSPLAWGAAALAVLIGALALLMQRRRRAESEREQEEDLFADIQLHRERLELDREDRQAPSPAVAPAPRQAAPEPAPAPEQPEPPAEPPQPEPEPAVPEQPTRGYGERRHDEYASDVDTGDVLAEADIYVAYGRHPQAIELLSNAVRNEPDNPQLVLKLLSLYAATGNQESARAQFARLQEIGDQPSLLEADRILRGSDGPAEAGADDLPLELELGDFDGVSDEPLDSDFAGLEIEDDGGEFGDDLDLSKDFDAPAGDAGRADEEDLIFAAEGNEMSTKLDLARAYIDMGDEEGARQILEEVSAEGSVDQREEAGRLIARLG